MANHLPLPEAARIAGKSEITIRRLIKANKIAYKKEKTLTGFVYLVDPEAITAHYAQAGEGEPIQVDKPAPSEEPAEKKESSPEPQPEAKRAEPDQGDAAKKHGVMEYWQKRSELYEDRYYKAMDKQAELREELGTWRGRAEHAQMVIAQLMPGKSQSSSVDAEPVTPQEQPVESVVPQRVESSNWVVALFVSFGVIILVLGGVVAYLFLTR